ncbi:unnamed protein product [Ectocarpus sp. 12 AP-2014]
MPARSTTLPAAPPAFSERFPRCGLATAGLPFVLRRRRMQQATWSP